VTGKDALTVIMTPEGKEIKIKLIPPKE